MATKTIEVMGRMFVTPNVTHDVAIGFMIEEAADRQALDSELLDEWRPLVTWADLAWGIGPSGASLIPTLQRLMPHVQHRIDLLGDGSPTTSTTETAITAPATTLPLPPDVPLPPNDFYKPPLDLSGLLGRSSDEAQAWGERQGFQVFRIYHQGDGLTMDLQYGRLNLMVDDDSTVVCASVG